MFKLFLFSLFFIFSSSLLSDYNIEDLDLEFQPKVSVDYIGNSFSLFYNQQIISCDKFSLDGLISLQYIGIGIDIDITNKLENNIFIVSGIGKKYLNYDSLLNFHSYEYVFNGNYFLFGLGITFF